MYVKRTVSEDRPEIVDGGAGPKRHAAVAHLTGARDQWHVIGAWLRAVQARSSVGLADHRDVFVSGAREEGAATTSMRPLLQHASRAHISNASAITSKIRPIGRFVAAQSPLACITCQHRQASTVPGSIERPRTDSNGLSRWALRRFSSSPRWAEDKKPPSSSDPIAMPPPASKPASSVDRTPEQLLERQDRLRREWEEQQRKREEEALRKKQQEEEARRRREEEEALRKKREAEALQKKQQEETAARKKQEQEQEALRKAQQQSQSKSVQPMPPPPPERAPSQPSAIQEPTQSEPAVSQIQEHVIDNVQRVPDEHLPSHQDRQRSNLEKRFTAMMDELLPKIAVVTQKVNTYTGTDYSGVEALRREIKEQGMLLSGYPQVASLTTYRETRQSSPSCD
jgi:sensitive to high expression protein 9